MAVSLKDPLLGQLVDGRYQVLSRIARGGMATVYLAIDRRLDREVALKVMHPHLAEGAAGVDFVARFRREARASARLAHPGLVAVLDQGSDGDTAYLAMEYVEGTNLRRVLVEEGPLKLGEALATVEAVLEALAVAHRAGLVHRDIKPENVLVASDGRLKVADFGLARAVTEVTATATGMVLGTVGYLAPEVVAHGISDTRTDLYAVGILLYELLTGAQPFAGSTPIQIAYQHVHTDIPAPSELLPWLPSEVDELAASLAAREPAERPADATAALLLVRRVRLLLDPALLSRRAGSAPRHALPDGGAVAAPDPDGTTSFELDDLSADGAGSLRRTISLRIGSGLDADPGSEEIDPRRRRMRLVLLLAACAAALGLIGWWFMAVGPGAYTTVPTGLVGSEVAAARAVLADAGLTAETTQVFDPTAPIGVVVATTPQEGGRVLKEGTVELAVSRGPDLRVVPAGLVGTPLADVRAALESVGLKVLDPIHDYSDTVPVGNVISIVDPAGAAVADGAELPVGTEITLTVSDGPAPVTVPGVVGQARDAAIAELTAQGLQVTEAQDYSEEYAEGVVMAQSPEGGTAGHRTDTVTITISKGPPLVEVPDVERKSQDRAIEILEEAGFEVEVEQAWPFFGQNKVATQSPEPFTLAPLGSTVTIWIR